ncbi:MAG TPA: phage holin family protein, partial [Gemmatimonadaceae bacterium]
MFRRASPLTPSSITIRRAELPLGTLERAPVDEDHIGRQQGIAVRDASGLTTPRPLVRSRPANRRSGFGSISLKEQEAMDRIERQGTRPTVPRDHDHNGRAPTPHPLDDASIGDLFRQMTSDASHLVQQEVHLAKAELRESLGHVRTMATGLAVAAALAIPGALALTAFLV